MTVERRKYPLAKVFLRGVAIQAKAAPVYMTVIALLSVIAGLSWTASVVATQILFDAISQAAIGKNGFSGCVIPLLLLAGVTLGQQVLNGSQNLLVNVMFEKSYGRIMTLLYNKLQLIDPSLFEDTAWLDDLNKAREGAGAITYFGMSMLMFPFFYFVYFASIGAYLFNLKPILILTLLVAFIPAMLAQIVRVKVFTKLEVESAPLRREFEYYQKAFCDREYFKETRILGAYRFFHRLFTDTLRLFSRKNMLAETRTQLLQTALNVTSFAGMAVASYILFTATMSGEITVGAFAAVFGTLRMLFAIMEEVVTYHLSAISKDVGKVTNFIRVLDITERQGARGAPDMSKGVVADGVSFTYPGRETPAVDRVSLSIARGETVAIVGENGAGKSTLVRLLTGIYRPSEGAVTIGGLDTLETEPSSLADGISGVFQKYQKYKMTLGENVAISDTRTAAAADGVETALEQADMKLDVELDAMLSPEFDGIDLSGGQWQRVAIARGLYRRNEFIVLDEPTSAIDPIEETRIYEQFQKLSDGKCSIIVTHRLGSIRLADRIVVMESGKITDVGSHDELLAGCGKYAEMWTAQAQWYERE